ncbi:MAG: hypothetical protein J7M34_03640 [Anaerolineae bacterium]|nr:hypothetical protein [Anaerolineae bacterium]
MGWSSVVRAVYLMCLTLTVLVAFVSYTSGMGFEAVAHRTLLTLIISALLGLGGILVLIPEPSSDQKEEGRKDDGGSPHTGGATPASA